MDEASLNTLLVLFSAGLGLMLFGSINFLCSRSGRRMRFAVGGSAALACTLLPLALASAQVCLVSFLVVSGALGAFALITSSQINSIVGNLLTLARKTVLQSAVFISAGVAMMCGSLAYFNQAEEAAFDRDMAFMEEVASQPPLDLISSEEAQTDLGRPVLLKAPSDPRDQNVISKSEHRAMESMGFDQKLIRSGKASDACNCHGWVFTGGRFWLGPDEVQKILEDNGYQVVSDPSPGDVVVYRQGSAIIHTAVVYSRGKDDDLLVEGKWGWMGVFVHSIGSSPYGKVFEFHRTPRGNNVVKGLEIQKAFAQK